MGMGERSFLKACRCVRARNTLGRPISWTRPAPMLSLLVDDRQVRGGWGRGALFPGVPAAIYESKTLV